MAGRISLERIEEAARVIDREFRDSVQTDQQSLSELVRAKLVLKVETRNPILSFKGRGADYYLHCRADRSPLVTASAGNFGQGMAYAARKRGIPLTVFAAENANVFKLDRMREFGAKVILAGADFDAAKAAARDYAAGPGETFVEDGLEPAITEGAGTIAIELLRWQHPFDAFVIPVGNGALINGIGTWVKERAPGTRVIGVCAAGAPSMQLSWRAGEIRTTPRADTFADGIGVRIPIPEALDDMRAIVDDMLLVDDAAILSAMRLIAGHAGLIVEPSGAAGVAAIVSRPDLFAGQSLATVLTGANVAPDDYRNWFDVVHWS